MTLFKSLGGTSSSGSSKSSSKIPCPSIPTTPQDDPANEVAIFGLG
jgi:hypothetical protein